jgi:predicted DNA-binding transcriptional regulator AlpA
MARKRKPVAARKPRAASPKVQKRLRETNPETRAYSIDQFCRAYGVGRDMYYAMLKNGTAPQCMTIGKRRLISLDAAARWQEAREAETAKRGQSTNQVEVTV